MTALFNIRDSIMTGAVVQKLAYRGRMLLYFYLYRLTLLPREEDMGENDTRRKRCNDVYGVYSLDYSKTREMPTSGVVLTQMAKLKMLAIEFGRLFSRY